MNSLYGRFRQNTFSDVYADVATFLTDYNGIGIPAIISTQTCTTLYYLLYSRYANNVIASSDTERFKYNLFAIIWQYGPTWEKELDIQTKLRALTEDELLTGSKAIYNSALNPSTAPSTNTLEELAYINQQNTTKYKKSKMEAYAMLSALIKRDVSEEFLQKFKKLFLVIVEPEAPLLYETFSEDEEDDTNS